MPQTDLSHLAMFADDTAIITQNKRFSVVISNLQHYVSLLELWLTDWKIKVNASKSACLMFTRRPRLPVGLTPSPNFLANPSPGKITISALNSKILMRRYAPFRGRHSEAISPLNAPSQPRPRLSVPIAADRTLQTSRVAPKPNQHQNNKIKSGEKRLERACGCAQANYKQLETFLCGGCQGSSNNSLDAKEVMTKMAQMMSQWGEMLSLLQSKL
ncbi:hypothetical protein TNCV_2501211 [Trichonephila clavipes]|nr:hypothetical protein TNCV_2501211 [Trichonephila clavipes]